MSKSPADTPERLLQAAAEVVSERGMAGLTTRAVAERAGLAPGVVHYHLGSVGALTLRLAEREAAARISRAEALWSAEVTVGERLAARVALIERDALDGRARIWRELTTAGWADPQVRAVVVAADAAVNAAVVRALAAAAPAIGLPPRAVEAAAGLICAAADGLELQRLTGSTTAHGELSVWLRALVVALEGGIPEPRGRPDPSAPGGIVPSN